jgi:Tfp pilus assembly protein PilF
LNLEIPRSLQVAICLVLLIVCAIVCYFGTLNYPFIFDDIIQIVNNSEIQDVNKFLKLEKIKDPRPLVDFTFALNYHYQELDVFGYHLVNLFFHSLVGIIVYFLALQIIVLVANNYLKNNHNQFFSSPYVLSLLAALLFICHPLQTQAVTYVVQRYTLMAAFFYIISVFFYIQARRFQNQNAHFPVYAFLFFLSLISGLMAFLSKQNAASLPGAILIMEYFVFHRKEQNIKKAFLWLFPLVAVFLVFIFYSAGLFSNQVGFHSLLEDVSALMQETDTVSRLEYLYTQFQVIPLYLVLFVWPVNQNADPMYPFAQSFFDPATYTGFIFLILLICTGILVRKKYPVISIGLFWFLVTLSVESSIIPIKDAMFEHRMYLPMFGLVIICAWLIGVVGRKFPVSVALFAFTLIAFLGVTTVERNTVWSHEKIFWQDILKKNPRHYRAYTNLGLFYDQRGEIQKALQNYRKALSIEPEFPYALLNYGALLGRTGDIQKAEDVLTKAVQQKPRSSKIHNNLGVVLATQGKFRPASEHFEKALQIDKGFLEASNNLALTYLNMGFTDKAAQQFRRSIDLEPDNNFATQWLYTLEVTTR